MTSHLSLSEFSASMDNSLLSPEERLDALVAWATDANLDAFQTLIEGQPKGVSLYMYLETLLHITSKLGRMQVLDGHEIQLCWLAYERTGDIPQAWVAATSGISLITQNRGQDGYTQTALKRYMTPDNFFGFKTVAWYARSLEFSEAVEVLQTWVHYVGTHFPSNLNWAVKKDLDGQDRTPQRTPLTCIAFALEPFLKELDLRHPNHFERAKDYALIQWQLIERMLEMGAKDIPTFAERLSFKTTTPQTLFDYFQSKDNKVEYKPGQWVRDNVVSQHWIERQRQALDDVVPKVETEKSKLRL